MKALMAFALCVPLLAVAQSQKPNGPELESTALRQYREGSRNYSSMPTAARAARAQGDDALAATIAGDYKKHYLDTLSDTQFFSKEHINFIVEFPDLIMAEGSQGRVFKFFYQDPNKASEFLGHSSEGYSAPDPDAYVRAVINKEELEDKLWNKGGKPIAPEPDWKRLSAAIARKYKPDYAQRLIPDAQMSFYQRTGNWSKYAEAVEEKMERSPPRVGGNSFGPFGDAFGLNASAWYVFLSSSDKAVLTKALKWSELAIKLEEPAPNPDFLDTKANVLYKLGRVNDAVAAEEQAIQLGIESEKRDGKAVTADFFKEFSDNLAHMKKGDPSWLTQ